ncbi:pseudaminic acid biosynthesis-associated methylase [Paenibacillus planticolens]|uniref:Methyltransferase domain-containing protein n=1 Tax=Paenibacillus planticolens TaxID=2654976 RepID=A0ABX1ZNH0_9BACL|nr:pseudaminic acid biosynthesis-associated methylase [Paenibacillus planticolens]NOV00468.1 methyltransferase domain-containing protein [Paenibacillus planticolens]
METEQMNFWIGHFGANYTDRNTYNPKELDEFYNQQFGVSRTEMNEQFLGMLDISGVLEVGCNTGNQLACLQAAGYTNLFGIELQEYAIEKAKASTRNINILQGSAFDLPFKDNFFDLVYTSGVLIHISPKDIYIAMEEMVRVSKKYIWGFEYYSDHYEEIDYRGNGNKMWKTNFSELFIKRFDNLKLVKEVKYPYLKDMNIDQMYLLEKQ